MLEQAGRALSPQLAALKSEFESASQHAQVLVEGLTAEQLKWRVAMQQWSIAECLVHLSLTTQGYLPSLRNALAHAPAVATTPTARPYRMDIMGRLLRWTLEPPPRLRTKTTAPFQPVVTGAPEKVLPEFLRWQTELLAQLKTAQGLALDQIKVASPFNPRVTYNLLSCFHILVAHERRHLWQAERVKQALSRAS